VFNILTIDTDEATIFFLLEFTVGMNRIGFLEEWSSKELINFM
jgi:hypothetical protein